jgi:hypothetical protein
MTMLTFQIYSKNLIKNNISTKNGNLKNLVFNLYHNQKLLYNNGDMTIPNCLTISPEILSMFFF